MDDLDYAIERMRRASCAMTVCCQTAPTALERESGNIDLEAQTKWGIRLTEAAMELTAASNALKKPMFRLVVGMATEQGIPIPDDIISEKFQ